MNWRLLHNEKPPKTGDYLVVNQVKAYGKRENSIFPNKWDARTQSFDYDRLLEERGEANSLTRIYAWCEITSPPTHPNFTITKE